MKAQGERNNGRRTRGLVLGSAALIFLLVAAKYGHAAVASVRGAGRSAPVESGLIGPPAAGHADVGKPPTAHAETRTLKVWRDPVTGAWRSETL